MQHDGDPLIFPVARTRRFAMAFNMAAYAIATACGVWLWNDGAGMVWAVFAVVSGVAFVHTVIVILRWRWVARMTPEAVELTGMWGGAQVFRWEDLVAHTIDPASRTGVIFATSGGVARDKERFGIVSLRMMGAEVARRFFPK